MILENKMYILQKSLSSANCSTLLLLLLSSAEQRVTNPYGRTLMKRAASHTALQCSSGRETLEMLKTHEMDFHVVLIAQVELLND